MSRAYKNRLKAIRDEKRRLGVKKLSRDQFETLRGTWLAALEGPFLGTLEDFIQEDDMGFARVMPAFSASSLPNQE